MKMFNFKKDFLNGQEPVKTEKNEEPIIHSTPFLAEQKKRAKDDRDKRIQARIKKDEPDLSRRRFIKNAAIAAGGIAVSGKLINKGLSYFEERDKNDLALVRESINNEMLDEDYEPDDEIVNDYQDESLESGKESVLNNLGDAFLDAYYEVSGTKRWPKEIFNDDYFIAIQLQESNYKNKAESDKQAKGTMQNTSISINDTFDYLNYLKKKGEIKFRGSEMFMGRNSLTEEEMKEVEALIAQNANYSRACGKLFFTVLWNKYDIGKDDYGKGDIKTARKKLAAAYNAGHQGIKGKKEKKWPGETIIYCRNVLKNMEQIDLVRAEMEKRGLNSKNNYAVMLLVKEMNGVEKGKDSMLNRGLDIFEKIHKEYGELRDEKLGRALKRA